MDISSNRHRFNCPYGAVNFLCAFTNCISVCQLIKKGGTGWGIGVMLLNIRASPSLDFTFNLANLWFSARLLYTEIANQL
jgi:hypothetical protein